eukprot:g101.t1
MRMRDNLRATNNQRSLLRSKYFVYLVLIIGLGTSIFFFRGWISHLEQQDFGGHGLKSSFPQEQGRVARSTLEKLVNDRFQELREKIFQEYQEEFRKNFQDRKKDGQSAGANKDVPFVPVNKLIASERKRILVTGGSGFVGSHLVDKLMLQGHEVTVLDNLYTGRRKNIAHWLHHDNFNFILHDIVDPIQLEVDEIYHLACPASPPHYQHNPIKTIKTSVIGTNNMLGLASRKGAKILLTSTSEVYGDPKVHPQSETYWGNVNPIGPRACYDEGKRAAETLMYAYQKQNNVDVRVARIFNTFGPRMHPNDGRVVSNFIIQALQNEDLTIYGKGSQTRSFQYVSDLVDGLVALMNSDYTEPCNLGNPDEYTIKAGTKDDPSRRQPDISIAKKHLGWSPKIDVKTGLRRTIRYFQQELKEEGKTDPIKPSELIDPKEFQ